MASDLQDYPQVLLVEWTKSATYSTPFRRYFRVCKKFPYLQLQLCEMHHIDLRMGKNARRLTLTHQNRDRLGKRNAINICELPRTITDAVTSIKMLGERYLWVDALCIEPGNEKDLAASIPIMGHIYTRSFRTVIAASGDDACSGLPGTNESSTWGVQQVIGPLRGGALLSLREASCCSYCITARKTTILYLARLTWDNSWMDVPGERIIGQAAHLCGGTGLLGMY